MNMYLRQFSHVKVAQACGIQHDENDRRKKILMKKSAFTKDLSLHLRILLQLLPIITMYLSHSTRYPSLLDRQWQY